MSALNGDDLIQQIAAIAIIYKDEDLKKHFGPDAPRVFRKCADRIEEAYKRDKGNELEKKTK